MIAAGLAALLSHWRRHWLQLFTLVAGLALATALWSGVQAINAEARASYAEAANTLGEGTLSRLRPPEGATIPESEWVRLRRAGWLASPVVEGRLGEARLIGLDPLTSPVRIGSLEEGSLTDLQAFLPRTAPSSGGRRRSPPSPTPGRRSSTPRRSPPAPS
ncbi:hypothetical protein [Rubellimicrobium mesophilum]|uniref:hypothetical protein n=1 Tax=Rubellimicrobium mesophilum TaxID=1123067 RepID=UPI00316ACE4D